MLMNDGVGFETQSRAEHHAALSPSQLKDIGSGNFGVAKLMRYKPTGELVAVKFIERGDKVGGRFAPR